MKTGQSTNTPAATPTATTTAVVLCGGIGSRLRPITGERPKVLVDIAGTQFLVYVVERLAREGIRRVVLSTGYGAEEIADYVASREWPVPVACVREPKPLGTGGAIRYVADMIDLPDEFAVINGDTVFTGRLFDLYDKLRSTSARCVLALVQVDNVERFGSVSFDETTGRVLSFSEKATDPVQEVPTDRGWISAGVYVLDKELVSSMPSGAHSIERDAFPGWVNEDMVACVPFADAVFLDIGTPPDFHRVEELFSKFRYEPGK